MAHTTKSGNGAGPKEETLTYVNYLKVDRLLSCVELRCPKFGKYEHDEHLFIIMHQAYELWFKQLIHEVDSIRDILAKKPFDERDIIHIISRLERMILIWKLLIDQLPVLETMSPLSFFNFREYLFPASGFQSYQFRIFENKMGIKPADRVQYQKQHYAKLCEPSMIPVIAKAEEEPTLFALFERWLENNIGLKEDGFNFWGKFKDKVNEYLASLRAKAENETPENAEITKRRATSMKDTFSNVLDEAKYKKLKDEGKMRLSHKALQGALLISHYRTEVRFHEAYQMITKLMDLDSLINKWRFHHVFMVNRMIGAKPGTGGSSGYEYLRTTVSEGHERYKIFKDLFNLATYYLPRDYVPELTADMKKKLSPQGELF